MKLLLIYFITLLFSLLMASGSEQTIEKEEACTKVVVSETRIASGVPAVAAGNRWLRNYFLLLKALSPVKQLDLPSDLSKGWKSFPSKILHPAQRTTRIELHCFCSAFKFMRLLCARHINGFYIYSLRELII